MVAPLTPKHVTVRPFIIGGEIDVDLDLREFG